MNRIAQVPVLGRCVPYMFTEGLAEAVGHQERGHAAYLLGKVSPDGWWYYFPVALAVKTPLALAALAALGLWRQRRNRDVAYPIALALTAVALAVASRVDIGIRHVLVVEPVLAILGAGAWAGAGKAVRALALGLAGWLAAESAVVHPQYLAYFNPIARGREWRFLADSNLDWGQDLAALGRWMRERGVAEIQLRYFGATEPEKVGVRARPSPAGEPAPGWSAVSVNYLVGLSPYHHDWAWYRAREPDARAGKSIWLYYRP